jgi:hypothetical protein
VRRRDGEIYDAMDDCVSRGWIVNLRRWLVVGEKDVTSKRAQIQGVVRMTNQNSPIDCTDSCDKSLRYPCRTQGEELFQVKMHGRLKELTIVSNFEEHSASISISAFLSNISISNSAIMKQQRK